MIGNQNPRGGGPVGKKKSGGPSFLYRQKKKSTKNVQEKSEGSPRGSPRSHPREGTGTAALTDKMRQNRQRVRCRGKFSSTTKKEEFQ